MNGPEISDTPTGVSKAGQEPSASAREGANAELLRRLKTLAVVTVGLMICFSRPLYDLVRFAARSELYSYILLVPVISLYLAWLKRDKLPTAHVRPASRLALSLALIGIVLIAGYWMGIICGWKPGANDRLNVLTLAFVLFFSSACAWLLGMQALRAVAFPLVFLIFMVPLPLSVERWIETFLQHGSAEAAYLLINLAGTPVLREGTQFQLPGLTIEVAPECSGIHSSLVLFMTAVLAGHLLLGKRRMRILLALAVIPLGILRNSIRIFTLAQLSVYVDRGYIDSPLHHRGGPLFFVVSLIPFFLLIWLLRKFDRRK